MNKNENAYAEINRLNEMIKRLNELINYYNDESNFYGDECFDAFPQDRINLVNQYCFQKEHLLHSKKEVEDSLKIS